MREGQDPFRTAEFTLCLTRILVLPGLLSLGVPVIAGARSAEHPGPQQVYAVRSRFSGTAGVVDFSTIPPRPPARAAAKAVDPLRGTNPQTAIQPRSAAALAGLLIGGVPSPRSGVMLTSRFGGRGDPLLGTARHHAGVDLAAPYGSLVVARSPGKVAAAGWFGGYGNCVIVDQGGGLQTRYGHLSRIVVKPGETVGPGSVLGLVGSTGRSTGPHLHYEVRVNGVPINPVR